MYYLRYIIHKYTETIIYLISIFYLATLVGYAMTIYLGQALNQKLAMTIYMKGQSIK